MKILLADDHALFCDGMRYILKKLGERVEILVAVNFFDALEVAKNHPDLDLALLDLVMPGSAGNASVKQFCTRFPTIPVVIVSGTDCRDEIERVMSSGAKGFISKMSPAQEVTNILRLVLEGDTCVPAQIPGNTFGQKAENKSSFGSLCRLSKRQVEVLQHLSIGLTNKEIAMILGLSVGTVKVHVASILQSLCVNSRQNAVFLAQRMGVLATEV